MYGTGIRRIIDAYADEAIKPKFEITDNTVRVILPCRDRNIEVTTDGRKVIKALADGMLLSASEIAESVGWSRGKAIRVLNTLLSAGYIKNRQRPRHKIRKALKLIT